MATLPATLLCPTAGLTEDRFYTNLPGVKVGLIGDLQQGIDDPFEHHRWIARLFAEKGCDIVAQIGDWGEWNAFSAWDSKVKKAHLHVDAQDDFDAVNRSLDIYEVTWEKMGYAPKRKLFFRGNHEHRVTRYLADNPEMKKVVSLDKLDHAVYGWEVYPFLKVVEVEGVAFSHFFPAGANGKVTQDKHGAPDAKAMVKRNMRSCVAGHLPGISTEVMTAGNQMFRGLILGSSYLHDPPYHGYQGTNYWRGVVLMHNVAKGMWNQCEVPLDILEAKYGD